MPNINYIIYIINKFKLFKKPLIIIKRILLKLEKVNYI